MDFITQKRGKKEMNRSLEKFNRLVDSLQELPTIGKNLLHV